MGVVYKVQVREIKKKNQFFLFFISNNKPSSNTYPDKQIINDMYIITHISLSHSFLSYTKITIVYIMLVISFHNNIPVIGGLGDRIVGLISVKVISKLLNKKFYISWTKENIKKYINYEKYDYELLDIKKDNIKRYNLIDKRARGFANYLMESTELFIDEITILTTNQEISQYLYKNELFKDKNYYADIFCEYKKLYTDILIPTTYLMDKIEILIKDKNNIIGLQFRCGDRYMVTNKNETHNNHITDIYEKMINIKKNVTVSIMIIIFFLQQII